MGPATLAGRHVHPRRAAAAGRRRRLRGLALYPGPVLRRCRRRPGRHLPRRERERRRDEPVQRFLRGPISRCPASRPATCGRSRPRSWPPGWPMPSRIVLNIRHDYVCQQAFAAVQRWQAGKPKPAEGQEEGARQDGGAHDHPAVPAQAAGARLLSDRRGEPGDRRHSALRGAGGAGRAGPAASRQAQHRAAHAHLRGGRGAGRLRQRRARAERQAAGRPDRVRRRLRRAHVRRAHRRAEARAVGGPADAAAGRAAERPGHRDDLPAAGIGAGRQPRQQDQHDEPVDDCLPGDVERDRHRRLRRWCWRSSGSPGCCSATPTPWARSACCCWPSRRCCPPGSARSTARRSGS